MKRYLFVVPPLAGHVNPTVPVARALATRGHRVAWAAHSRHVRPLLASDAELLPLHDLPTGEAAERFLERARDLRGLESLQFLWEEMLLPLARDMLPSLLRAITDFAPDVLVVDHQAIAGALAARRIGVTWASFCTTSASVVDSLTVFPKVKHWLASQIARMETALELEPVPSPVTSPHLVVVFSTEALVGAQQGAQQRWPAHFRFVGPSIQDRPDSTPFPWEALAARPRVFVSLGTVSADAGARFYATTVQALGNLDVQVILAAQPSLVPDAPPSFIVRDRVPQLALLPHVHAVVCHAGHNTVCESLANGLPLVVAPIRDDQPIVAQQIVQAGAGIRVRYGHLSPLTLRDAVVRLLCEPEFRRSAGRIRDSFQAAGGASSAADALEAIA